MGALELKIPPLLLTLIFAALMWWIAASTPALDLAVRGRVLWAAALAGLGAAVELSGVRAFRQAKTTMNPLNPEQASSIVTGGIYRVTRNPMYLGFLLLLAGWAAFLENGAGFAMLPVFVLYMNRFQILPEERAMHGRFGEEFARYRARVRRWI